jgi:formylglycine-generating enzyme required for sulfatase activity
MPALALSIISSITPLLYEVSTHRQLGYWAVERSGAMNSALARLEWNSPEVTFQGPRLAAVNAELSELNQFLVTNSNPAHLVAAGCVAEDGSGRFFKHFCEGTTGLGFKALFMPSWLWGSTEMTNEFSWERARMLYRSSLLEPEKETRQDRRVDLFRSLGQVLHLIQDAHQPSHTRDDSHSHLLSYVGLDEVDIFDGYSALEVWAADAVGTDPSRRDGSVESGVRFASPSYRSGISGYISTSIRESARQTNREFFSDDTIWHNGVWTYPEPNDQQTYTTTEGVFPFTQTYLLAAASLHNQIPPLKMAKKKDGLLDVLGVYPASYTLVTASNDVVRQHAQVLIPRAVSECAGALNHFFRLGIEADIDTTTAPGEGRLKLKNVSNVPGASSTDLTVNSGASVEIRYETVSGRMLPVPGVGAVVLGNLAPNAQITLPLNLLALLQPLANPATYPSADVRARSDWRFVVVVDGIVGQDPGVGADVWAKPECPNGFPTPAGMVAIQAGTFQQGSNAPDDPPYLGQYYDTIVRQVTLSYCFWMGATEVTQAQYQALMGTNPSYFPGANNPVERVNWDNAQAYCAALTTQQAALGNVPAGYQFRLPTEAEWEYACRAGTTTEFNTGAALLCGDAKFLYSNHSNSSCNSSSTVPVSSYAPNAWGLYDMHGNVFEWCLDSYAGYITGPVTDPFVTGGPYRVFRGGSWGGDSVFCRSAFRLVDNPGLTNLNLGFRVVLAPVLVP